MPVTFFSMLQNLRLYAITLFFIKQWFDRVVYTQIKSRSSRNDLMWR